MFRPEAIAHRSDRLSGDVAIAVPVAWQMIGYLIFGALVIALIFLSLARYARVETVGGSIVPDSGISTVVPSRSGMIAAVSVREGQTVTAGTQLAVIRTEDDSGGIQTAAQQIEQAIAQQDRGLAAEMAAMGTSARAQQGQLAAQQAGLSAEIVQLNAQIAIQQELIETARRDLERVRVIAERGFISGRDIQSREETLLSRQQGLSQLQQSLSSRRAALAEAGRSAVQSAAQARAQAASMAATRAGVAQQAASASGARSFVLRAPVAGRVTAVTARVGQAAGAQVPLMAIVPAGATLRAELGIPGVAIGFVRPGQAVRLAVDAFPYQRFGTVAGRVQTVAQSPINQRGPDGSAIPVYLVTVALNATQIEAFGRREPLVSGMTLTARIVTEQQSLLEWLFEPLFAVRRR